ncbi:ribonuclease Y [Parenemella sanctibonifatiensis]|uniref:ribonuclease Y n=1 Tax=Parenemella sanctibonifatiensis TaxID=2016505 RepID=UPI001E34B618|nr:ribonuclease Y [Parenemella sanctibonifatiensis]
MWDIPWWGWLLGLLGVLVVPTIIAIGFILVAGLVRSWATKSVDKNAASAELAAQQALQTKGSEHRPGQDEPGPDQPSQDRPSQDRPSQDQGDRVRADRSAPAGTAHYAPTSAAPRTAGASESDAKANAQSGPVPADRATPAPGAEGAPATTEEAAAATTDDRSTASAQVDPAEAAASVAAQERAAAVLAAAEADVAQMRRELQEERAELREQRSSQERRESRLNERELKLDGEAKGVETRSAVVEQIRYDLINRAAELNRAEADLAAEAERIAGLTAEEARAEVLAAAEHEARLDATTIQRTIEKEAERNAQRRAQEIVVGAIQRMAADQTSESVVATVDLPSDDMKGRIIGREGRNIRTFEQVTGVNVLIDDTPESVQLSCFDPVRRETARIAMADLVADGRIHPSRIEEAYERATEQINERILRAAEDACHEVGITDLHPDLMPILGSLRYRTSYGQNVLKHLVESAHLAGLMAAELHLDPVSCKRAAFLHDIGKALTHEVEGPHAIIGADLARRYGEHEDIVHAIEAHHNEVEPQTVEAVLVQAADAISGARPGARRESLEAYVKRLEQLEQIAGSREGVDRVFAMQAGRELRVMVHPDQVDDAQAQVLAREIARQVQEELTYPGQIKITVVRESRATELAR